VELRKYSRMLADIAGVEDLTDLEETEDSVWVADVLYLSCLNVPQTSPSLMEGV
jgi:hypothetical protein